MKRTSVAVVVAAAALAAGCGGSSEQKKITVSAAASLKVPLPKFEPGARYQFGGSDELAAQIRGGAKPDVYVAANTQLPQSLFKAGLVEQPVKFATNKLVIAVPQGSKKVTSFSDLMKPGVKIAAGSKTVPVGAYLRQALGHLPKARRKAIERNIRSNEPDVGGVVGKVTQGAVDAGIVYASDVKTVPGKLKAIQMPAVLSPKVEYAAAAVKKSKKLKQAREYVKRLREPNAQKALRGAGFGPAP